MTEFHTYELPNGIRGIHRRVKSGVAHCALIVNAGSRDERAGEHGLAHFTEHAFFKGTQRRKAWQVNCRLENLGGELNAFTTKEETTIHATTLRGDFAKAAELIADIAFRSTFPEREIEREKEVIADEINTYKDSPAEMLYDTFEDMLFEGSELGHNILGTPESVRMLNSEDCRAFIDRLYRPEDMVLYCADPATPSKVEKLAFKHFGRLRHPGSGTERTPVPPAETFSETIDRNGHQAHTLLGTRLFGREDPRSHALFLLNNHIGGPGMSSLLNQELREKRGYVYTVESNGA